MLFSRLGFGAGLAVALVSVSGGANCQDPVDERLRKLEAENIEFRARLKKSEDRAESLENELSKYKGSPGTSQELDAALAELAAKAKDFVTNKSLTRSGDPIKFYGFVRTDMYYNTARMDGAVIPFFVQPENNIAASRDDNTFAFDARLTRFGIDVDAGKIGDAKTTAKLEIDFANFPAASASGAVAESRETPRIRLAYINLNFGSWSARFGQDWDVISPLMPWVNAESLMWYAGNLGDRRPQAQIAFNDGDAKETAYEIRGSLGMTGAVNNQDIDPTGATAPFTTAERDGIDSGLPHAQLRAGTTWNSWVDGKRAGIGAWGAIGRLETDKEFNGSRRFTEWVGGIDLTLPIVDRILVKGEWWYGDALGDFRGGINQSINTVKGKEVAATGGWGELQWNPFDPYTFVFGATIDKPSQGDLTTGAKEKNWAAYIGNRYDWGGGLKTGLDVIYWETDYVKLSVGNAVRVDFYIQLDF